MSEVRISPGRWLNLARATWLAIAVLTVALFAGDLPIYYRQLQTVCTAEPFQNSPTLSDARTLAAVRLSVDFPARYFLALDVLIALMFGAVATAIFLRRSDDCMGVFVRLAL